MPESIDVSGVSKTFGQTHVLQDIAFSVRAGEFLSLVGMSGCGKSTLLRIIAGLESPDSGRIGIGGRDVTTADPADRNLAMVFQSYALYPHMTVRQNIATPLRMRQLSFAARLPLIGRALAPRDGLTAIAAAVERAAEMLQIAHLLDRKPAQLSGGQRQRVAVARALVRQPAAFLMDEPLSNLDAKLRAHMRTELAALHRSLGATFIYVTHDQVEAMTMSDRIALMVDGRIVQLGTPDELYRTPASLTVARFIGSPTINLLAGEVDASGRLTVQGLELGGADLRGPVTVGIRAEDLRAVSHGIPARVRRAEAHGADRFVTCELAGGEQVTLRQPTSDPIGADADGWLHLDFAPERAHVFGPDGFRRAAMQTERAVA